MIKRKSLQGQAIVELALIIPILLMLLIGLVDIGFVITAQIGITNAAWEGARAGAISSQPSQSDTEIIGAVKRALPPNLDPDLLQISISPEQNEPPRNQPYPAPRGSPITITISYPLKIFPFDVNYYVSARAVSQMEYTN